jgi:hypothetical protein
MSEKLPQKNHSLVYQAEDGTLKIDVRLEDESVWLTQPLMAELFQTSQQNISHHIRMIYAEGELLPEATHKKYLSVRQEGARRAGKEGQAEVMISCCNLYKSYFFPVAASGKNFEELGG